MMCRMRFLAALAAASLWVAFVTAPVHAQTPPSSFDLRSVDGHNYVTSVKSQIEGTCWTHGVMAAVEGNLLMTGNWAAAGELSEPNLAEYHLDWWNGFNRFNNDDTDPPTGGGLTVHQGGDYRVASAYMTRGEGAVRDVDGQSFGTAPTRYDPTFHYYYARDIEWYTAGSGLANINLIKTMVMTHGVMGTALCYDGSFMSGNIHYQPPGNPQDPNHAVAIIGWDDNKDTQASQNGAWLIKNSWGSGWGEDGYFWISYYDKHCGQHPEMGAVSFQNSVLLSADTVFYYHDYHGWRDTLETASEAFNAFSAVGESSGFEELWAVSFFTAADDVDYTVVIYDGFQGGNLINPLAVKSGTIAYTGFHTIDLDTPVTLYGGDDFYVYVQLSAGGHPYDRTSDVPVLLGNRYRTTVESSSTPGQSYYFEGGAWRDLYNFNDTANFCIKALTRDLLPIEVDFPEGIPEYYEHPGREVVIPIQIQNGIENYVPGSGQVLYRFSEWDDYEAAAFIPQGGDLYHAVVPAAWMDDNPQFYFRASGDGGATFTLPRGAPEFAYGYDLGVERLLMEDNFETDLGWTVVNENLTGGAWVRVDPNGTVNGSATAQPEDDNPNGTGTNCWVTGQGSVGGGASEADVDGGPTALISPVFNLENRDAIISFYYWFYNDDGDDRLSVGIKINEYEWRNIVVLGSAQWAYCKLRLSDYYNCSTTTQIRFRAMDRPNNSVTEAGIDDFRIEYVDLDPSFYSGAGSFSAASGCDIGLYLDDPWLSGRVYLVLGSMSGSVPGTALPGTGIILPINHDWFTSYILSHMNGNVFRNFRRTMDAQGRAIAVLHVPAGAASSYVGQAMTYAFTTAKDYDYASNPMTIEIEP